MKRRFPQAKAFHPVSFLVAIIISLIVAFANGRFGQAPQPSVVAATSRSTEAPASMQAHVVKVYDGDTVKLSNGEKVRLIGIDTPELHNSPKLYRDAERSGQDVEAINSMGAKSFRFTKDLLDGKDVRLEMDTQSRDKYGRILAYVYLNDGTFANEEIIKNGYASPMTIPPNVKHSEEFKSLYEEARAKKIGLWGSAR